MASDKKLSLGGEQGRSKVGPGNSYKSPRTSVLFRIQSKINFVIFCKIFIITYFKTHKQHSVHGR